MVEAAEADVVSPAVAADDPDAAAQQVVSQRGQLSGSWRAQLGKRRFQRGYSFPLGQKICFAVLFCRQQPGDQGRAEFARQRLQLLAGGIGKLVAGEPHTKAKFGIVFKQRIAPGRAAPVFVLAIGGGR